MDNLTERMIKDFKSILGRTHRLEGSEIFGGHESCMSFDEIRKYALTGIANGMARHIANDMVDEQYSISVSERDYPNRPGSIEISGAAYIMKTEDYTTLCRIAVLLAARKP